MNKGFRFVGFFMAAALVASGLGAGFAEAQTKRISIGTADTGGVYYIYGGGIAKVISANIPNTQATAEVTPGAVDNVKMLQNQSLDFAFTKSDIAAEAIKAAGPFGRCRRIPDRAAGMD
jgi:TRAP transporter TAXI family solute receptor